MEVSVFFLLVLMFTSHGIGVHSLLHESKRSQDNSGSCVSKPRPKVFQNSHNFSVDLRMPGVIPATSDTYLCMASPVPTGRDAYIVDFIPHANMNTVHHMLLFGCRIPASTSSSWDCGKNGICKDESSVMYAWARNAPHPELPKDVGFKVGQRSGLPYFVLQIHYGDIGAFGDHHRDCSGLTLTMTTKPQPFIAGIYLLMSVDTVILPGKKVTNADVACDYTSYPIYPFAFRTHTHQLGKVVSGYRVRDGKWTLIGRQSPQLPQAFYPTTKNLNIKYGDTVAARCVFTGEGRTTKTYIGSTSNDEMCNFYIMYYMDRKHSEPYMSCVEPGSKELFKHIPAEANVPIPVSPEQMHMMIHMGDSQDLEDQTLLTDQSEPGPLQDEGDLSSLMSQLLGQSEDLFNIHKYKPHKMQRSQAELMAQINSLIKKKDLQTEEDPILVRDRVHKFHQLPTRGKLVAEGQDFHYQEAAGWPQSPLQLGQVSGLAVDSNSNLVIFHRGDHSWRADSFNSQAQYQQRSLGPIQQSTILVVDPAKGNILKASGRNIFYLPHGITTDKENNYWVTDIALHQVLKVSGDGRDAALITLGEAFTPGSDKNHFCKPTDVAEDPETGNIFVSDGYCNARILKFSADGKYLSEWGSGSSDRRRHIPFLIPHSLVFLPDKKDLCVADRENGRIQCFLAETGEFVKEIKKDEFEGKVFAITYSPAGDGLIFAVNGQSSFSSAPLSGFVIDYPTKEILDTFRPNTKDFEMPHDIVQSQDGSVFVADVASKSVFKFIPEKIETFIQAKVKPNHTTSKTAPIQEKQSVAQQNQLQAEEKSEVLPIREKGVLPAVITTLLLIPLVLVISMGVFLCWRKKNQCEVKAEQNPVGGILGKIRGKAVGSLNLGNFFASHKGYSRQGFDQLSTEGSDQERNDEDSSDSETEEYSALQRPQLSS
uniref:Peptidylglycine alpha-amidating monooxygenase n=1 Tax=Gouania willdenowi TaxID=441366 RepID=A0A8C5HS14_GOUWI